MRKLLSLLLCTVLLFACLSPALSAAADSDPIPDTAQEVTLTPLDASGEQAAERAVYQAGDTVHTIVLLDGECAAQAGDRGSARAAAQSLRLARQHTALRTRLLALPSCTFVYDYTTLLNGMALDVPYGELDALRQMDGVRAVYISNEYSLPSGETPQMETAGETTGAFPLQSKGYTGKGTVIAVLDTGLNTAHEAFRDNGMTVSTLTRASLSKTTTNGVYLSAKVPFAYDYADNDADVTDAAGHGTHVSGIAAGFASSNGKVTFRGAAPGAQLLAMKIFSDNSNSTYSGIYFKALEDAYLLGADLVNLSLGSISGLSYSAELEDEVFGNIFALLEEKGVMVCAAAGNDGYTGARMYSSYMDYGTLGSPASYAGNLSVASADNGKNLTYALSFGGKTYSYCQVSYLYDFYTSFPTLTPYALIGGYGDAADYQNVPVRGKLAVIAYDSGSTSAKLESRIALAHEKGALGIIFVNNTEDTLFFEFGTEYFPIISVVASTGAALSSAGTKTLQAVVDPSHPGYYAMSGYSSWGCGSDLTLNPKITAPGGNIRSSYIGGSDAYTMLSGTSMATPNVTGATAALLQLLREKYSSRSKTELAGMAEAWAQSCAQICAGADGISYSPRLQGCGMIDVNAAAGALAYLSDPICELGDDPAASGVFHLSFTLENPDRIPLAYTITPEVLVPAFEVRDGSTYATSNNVPCDTALSEGDYTFTTDRAENTVRMTASDAHAVINVTLRLSAQKCAALSAAFPNGWFVEGFVKLHSAGSRDLHATYLGFCGDWNKAGVAERCDDADYLQAQYDLSHTYYPSNETPSLYAFTPSGDVQRDDSGMPVEAADGSPATYAQLGYSPYERIGSVQSFNSAQFSGGGYLGDNPLDPEVRYTAVHNALASYGSDYYQYNKSLQINLMTLRNAASARLEVVDADTGTKYYDDATKYCQRSHYTDGTLTAGIGFYWSGDAYRYDTAGNRILTHHSDEYGEYDTAETHPLADGTRVFIRVYTTIDYPGAAEALAWQIPCTMDSTAPTVQTCRYDPAQEKLYLTVSENQFLRNVRIGYTPAELAGGSCAADCGGITLSGTADHAGASQSFTVDMHGLSEDRQTLQLSDYAGNTVTYSLNLAQLQSSSTLHTIHVGASDDGKIGSGCDVLVPDGQDCTLAVVPASRYVLDDVIVDGASVGAAASYRFENVTADHTISAFFRPITAVEYFTDLKPGAWYIDGVNFVFRCSLMDGVGGTRFSPNSVLSRAMLVTILYRFEGCPDVTEPRSFSDVKAGAYYYNAVSWASGYQIVAGFPDGSFRPNDPVTREQMAAILYRHTGSYRNGDVSAYADLSGYTDAAQISVYARNAMHWAVGGKLLSGTSPTLLSPRGNSTRAQFATVLMRYQALLYPDPVG
jgi:subtilisin family serine protease